MDFLFLVHSAQEASGIDMNDNYLFSGTDNSMLGVWSLKTGNQVGVLRLVDYLGINTLLPPG